MHSTLFTNALIFDGHSPDVLTDRYVLVTDRRFAAIGSERPDIADADVVDLNGKLIMPGLIDCHFHAYACKVDQTELQNPPGFIRRPPRSRTDGKCTAPRLHDRA